MDSERLTGKNDGFWLLWGIFKQYIKQILLWQCQQKHMLIHLWFADWQKISNIKENPRRKTDSNKLPSAYEVLIRLNVM